MNNNYEENNNVFGFNQPQNMNLNNAFDYTSINGLGESDYENEDLFGTGAEFVNNDSVFNNVPVNNSEPQNVDSNFTYAENQTSVSNVQEFVQPDFTFNISKDNVSEDAVLDFEQPMSDETLVEETNPTVEENEDHVLNNEVQETPTYNFDPMTGERIVSGEVIESDASVETPVSVFEEESTSVEVPEEEPSFTFGANEGFEFNNETEETPVETPASAFEEESASVEVPEEEPSFTFGANEGFVFNNETEETPVETPASAFEEEPEVEKTIYNFNPTFEEQSVESTQSNPIDTEEEELSFNSSLEDDIDLPIVKAKNNVQVESTNMMSNTPIEELNKLTEYKEEKVESVDIKSLFNRVGVNVKEASDIFMKNTEMKEKIDNRFEELKKLQSEVEKSKKNQYDEINSYKEEVFAKLTEKKDEIEKRINKLKDFQANLEKEKEEFEKYRKQEKEEIEKVQKEIQEAYDSRRDELTHIEDVLRKQKDSLDEERSQLSLDRIQYESDKNELANNLLKFNEIVDSFTSGMDKAGKEE